VLATGCIGGRERTLVVVTIVIIFIIIISSSSSSNRDQSLIKNKTFCGNWQTTIEKSC